MIWKDVVEERLDDCFVVVDESGLKKYVKKRALFLTLRYGMIKGTLKLATVFSQGV
jgi:hypothetical protein